MTAVTDSLIFSNLLSHPQTAQIWSDQTRTQYYLLFESALAKVQADLGIIPKDAASQIISVCKDTSFLDWDLLRQQTERIGYPVLGVVKQLVSTVNSRHHPPLPHGDDSTTTTSSPSAKPGEWAHWGATTQDVTDTATVLQLRDTLHLLTLELHKLIAALSLLARAHKATPMPARSNLQHAVPITFGFKLARLLATFHRHQRRLAELRPRLLVLEFGGAAGTLATLSPTGADTLGLACHDRLAAELGLAPADIAWHTERDRIAEFASACSLLTGTCAKFALDLKLLAQTEVAEAAEPFAPARGSSSTMPQKRNPVGCAYVGACAAGVRSLAGAVAEAMVADHERSTGPWEVEWIALPQLCPLAVVAVRQTRVLLEGLDVRPEGMARNLGLSRGLLCSEAVMMALGPRLGRQYAHDLVYGLCEEAGRRGKPLADLLVECEEIDLPRGELERLCDPANYLGLSVVITERVLEAVEGGRNAEVEGAR